jgi:GH24 family phage-related lysozyme (muramidase)
MLTSIEAFNFIINEEVSGQENYTKHLANPTYPGGQSGVTIGIGSDIGYTDVKTFNENWGSQLTSSTAEMLREAIGRRGARAHSWCASYAHTIVIPWPMALQEFCFGEIVPLEKLILFSMPPSQSMSATCFGVLVSLAYNRGMDWDLAGDRYREMRAIKAMVLQGRSAWGGIPAEIEAMVRLWPIDSDIGKGLQTRRKAEAALFRIGLSG